VIAPARFREIWDRRKPGGEVSHAMTAFELAAVNAQWNDLGGDSCWADAFHALWRKADPTGHAALFRGSFYASPESMHPCETCDGEGEVFERLCINGRDVERTVPCWDCARDEREERDPNDRPLPNSDTGPQEPYR
jgi:hypothetical protein